MIHVLILPHIGCLSFSCYIAQINITLPKDCVCLYVCVQCVKSFFSCKCNHKTLSICVQLPNVLSMFIFLSIFLFFFCSKFLLFSSGFYGFLFKTFFFSICFCISIIIVSSLHFSYVHLTNETKKISDDEFLLVGNVIKV